MTENEADLAAQLRLKCRCTIALCGDRKTGKCSGEGTIKLVCHTPRPTRGLCVRTKRYGFHGIWCVLHPKHIEGADNGQRS